MAEAENNESKRLLLTMKLSPSELRTLAKATDQESLRQQIAETMAYVQAQ